MNRDLINAMCKILIVCAFTVVTFLFFAYFLFATEKLVAYFVWFFIVVVDFLIAFLYKLVTKSRLLLNIAVVLIILFLLYILVSAIL